MEPHRSIASLLSFSGVVQVFGLVCGLVLWLLGAGAGVWASLAAVVVTFAVGVWGLLTMKAISPSFDLRRDLPLWLLGPCLGFGLLSLLLLRVVLPREVFLGVFVLVPVAYVLLKGVGVVRGGVRGRVDVFGNRDHLVFAYVVVGLSGLSLAAAWPWSLPITFVAFAAAALLLLVPVDKPLVGWLLVVPLLLVAWRMSEIRPDTWWLGAAGIPTDESQLEAYANGLVEFGPLVNPLWHGYDGLTATAYHHLSYLFVGIINALASAQPYTVQHLVAPAVFAVSLVASLLLFLGHLVSRLATPPRLNVLTIAGLLSCMVFLRIEGAPSNTFGPTVLLASFVVIAKACEQPASWRNAALVGMSVVVMVFAKGPYAVGTVGAAIVYALFDIRQRWKAALLSASTFLIVTTYLGAVGPTDTILRIEFWSRTTMYSEFGLSIYHFKLFLSIIILPLAVGFACAIIVFFERSSTLRQWMVTLSVIVVGGALSQVLILSNEDRGHRYFAVPAYICSGLLLATLALSMNGFPRFKNATILAAIMVSVGVYWFIDYVTSDFESEILKPLPVVSVVSVALTAGAAAIRLSSSSLIQEVRGLVRVFSLLLIMTGLLYHTTQLDQQSVWNAGSTNAIRSWSNWYGDEDTIEVITLVKEQTEVSDLIAISTCELTLLAKDYCEPDYRVPAISGRRFLASDSRFSFIDPKTKPDVLLSGPLKTADSDKVLSELSNRGASYFVLRKSRVQDRGITIKEKYSDRVLLENGSFLVVSLAEMPSEPEN